MRDGYLIESDENTWTLTELGHEAILRLPLDVLRNSREIVRLYSPLTSQQLLDVVYSRHPWFTGKAVRETRRAVTQPQVSPAVYTIGYERFLVDGFMDELLRCGIQRIIDVRNNPASRRYGFHGSTLSRICQSLDLEYQHFPSVGIPALERSGLGDTASYERLFAMYESGILPAQGEVIAQIATLLVEKPSALMCMEADPDSCHRLRLAKAVAPVANLPIVHLGWPR